MGVRGRIRFLLPLVFFALVAVARGAGADVPLRTGVHDELTTSATGAKVSTNFTLTLADQQKTAVGLFWANW